MNAQCPAEERWMEYLEGTPSPELDAHLTGCRECSQSVSQARSALAALSGLGPGSRALCPPPEEIAEAETGVSTLSVRMHLALCPHCAGDVEDLKALLAPAPGEVVARWIKAGLELVSQTLAGAVFEPLAAPALRGTGASSGLRLKQVLEEGELRIELVSADGESFGLTIGMQPPPPPGTRVDLEKQQCLLESRGLEAGRISFLGLKAGTYTVHVRRPAQAPLSATVEVQGDPSVV